MRIRKFLYLSTSIDCVVSISDLAVAEVAVELIYGVSFASLSIEASVPSAAEISHCGTVFICHDPCATS